MRCRVNAHLLHADDNDGVSFIGGCSCCMLALRVVMVLMRDADEHNEFIVVVVIMLRVSESELNRQRQDCHQRVLSAQQPPLHGQ